MTKEVRVLLPVWFRYTDQYSDLIHHQAMGPDCLLDILLLMPPTPITILVNHDGSMHRELVYRDSDLLQIDAISSNACLVTGSVSVESSNRSRHPMSARLQRQASFIWTNAIYQSRNIRSCWMDRRCCCLGHQT